MKGLFWGFPSMAAIEVTTAATVDAKLAVVYDSWLYFAFT
jgi:hypothetical protein